MAGDGESGREAAMRLAHPSKVFGSIKAVAGLGLDLYDGEVFKEPLFFLGDRYEARIQVVHEQHILLTPPPPEAWREGQRIALRFPSDQMTVWQA